jgi:uncharacterized protein (DUF934 family)
MPKLIKIDRVIDDATTRLATDARIDAVPLRGPVLVPLALWQEHRAFFLQRRDAGVWLAPSDDPAALADDAADLDVIAIEFPKFGDGRGYSIGRLLRDRYGYAGELRAFGDILRDHYFFLRECGFDALEVRPDRDPQQELAGFETYERTYASSVRTPRPWFRTRSASPPGDVWFPCA